MALGQHEAPSRGGQALASGRVTMDPVNIQGLIVMGLATISEQAM